MFRFKQFSVDDAPCAMKVGTDGVVLGAWATVGRRVLDVGCGCGLIGLMMAQRGASHVDMIDIDPEAARCAAANAAASPWTNRLAARCADFLGLGFGQYDAIVSNPPFFANGELAPDSLRAAARHEGGLTPGAFMRKAAALLAPGGTVSIIVPTDRAQAWTAEAGMAGLSLCRRLNLFTRLRATRPRRVLLEFSTSQTTPQVETINIHSQEYKQLVEPFYL